MTVKLKPITENSWLVLGDTEDVRIGLLSEVRNQYILMVRGVKQHFLDRKDVTNYFNEDVFSNLVENDTIEQSPTDYFINGYPIDFENPHEVISTGNSLPLYSKKATSEVYYSAGYYCLNFPKNWMPAFCPKLSTLETYQYSGPYKTEMEMKSNLQKLRKQKAAEK
jgi:hypothetical protein